MVWIGGALALAAAVALALGSIDQEEANDDPRAGSEVVSEQGRPLHVATIPTRYRILYRVESRGGGELVVGTEEVRVRRPFDARVDERPGDPAPPDGKAPADTVTVTRFGYLGVESRQAQPVALNVPPNPGVGDFPSVDALEAARAQGHAELGPRRRIAAVGRECQVYRLGAGIGGGPVVPVGKGGNEAGEVCIDDAGLVLEDVSFLRERVLRRMVAVEVDESPELPSDLFEGPDVDPPPADQGGGSILAVEPTSRPPGDPFYELADPPRGFRHRGRYALIPPQAEEFADPLRANSRVAGVVDVWVDGPRFIVVDQSETLGRVKPFDPHPHAVPVDVGALGQAATGEKGELIFGLRTSEVRVVQDGGRYVRVYGSVAPDDLVDVARALTPEPGGELVYLSLCCIWTPFRA